MICPQSFITRVNSHRNIYFAGDIFIIIIIIIDGELRNQRIVSCDWHDSAHVLIFLL